MADVQTDDKRKGEIALLFLKHLLKEDGFRIDKHFRRKIGNIAKQTGVPFAELLTFSTELARELIDEVSKINEPATKDELEGDFYEHHGH